MTSKLFRNATAATALGLYGAGILYSSYTLVHADPDTGGYLAPSSAATVAASGVGYSNPLTVVPNTITGTDATSIAAVDKFMKSYLVTPDPAEPISMSNIVLAMSRMKDGSA